MLMFSCEIGEIGDEKKIIEELDRAGLMMLLVYDDVAAACLAVSSKCGCIRGVSVRGFLHIP